MASDGAPPIHGHSTDPGLMQVDVEEDMPRKSIKRPCDDDSCDECEFVVEPSRKRFKTASDAICLPSQSLAVQFNVRARSFPLEDALEVLLFAHTRPLRN